MAIKITVLYPDKPGARFDLAYYLDIHIPLSIAKQGDKLRGLTVDIGTRGADEGSRPPYIVSCHLLYDSLDDFKAAFFPHARLLQADMVNYTDIETIVQVSEVRSFK